MMSLQRLHDVDIFELRTRKLVRMIYPLAQLRANKDDPKIVAMQNRESIS